MVTGMSNHVLYNIKLNHPELPYGFVSRKKLEARLEEACDKDIVLVSGPAGYGKSLALSAWSRSTEHVVLWFSLGPEDASLASFYSLFSYGLSQRLPGFSASHPRLEPDIGEGIIPEQAPRYLGALLARQLMDCLPGQEIVLVLDDYQLCDGEAINSFILELSNQSSSRIKCVISSRMDPGLR